MSVSFLCTTFAISGVRFAATRLVSEEIGSERGWGIRAAMRRCFAYAMLFGMAAFLLLRACAEAIGFLWIGDARTVLSLRIMAYSMPMVSLCSAVSGYFTACGRVWKPTLVHLVEQLATIALVAIFLRNSPQGDIEKNCASVMLGTRSPRGAVRFKTLRIHLLPRLGNESVDKTAAACHRACAV